MRNSHSPLKSFSRLVSNQPWLLRDAFFTDLLRLLLLEEEDDNVVDDDDEEDLLRFFFFSSSRCFSLPALSRDLLRSIVVESRLGLKMSTV